MADRTLLAIHDRIDSEHFDIHLLKEAVRSLQQRVIILESEVRALRREALADETTEEILRDTEAALRKVSARGS
jgi:hypothetical protein